MTDFDQIFGNLRRPVFVEDPNAVPQNMGPGNGQIQPEGFLADDSVTSDVIRANAVVASKISAGAVEADKIAAGAISTDKLAANAVTADKIAANTITAAQIAANTITGAQIAANTITASDIAANTITANEIAANTLTANEIAANAITASEIAADAVTTNKILAGNVTSSRMEINITGKNFGANSGTTSAPGYYYGSGTNYGFVLGTSVPFIGSPIYTVQNGSIRFWVGLLNGSVTLRPMSDNLYGLGDSTLRWTDVWAVDGTINTSDRTIKKDIEDSPLGLKFIEQLRPVRYRWKDTVDTQAMDEAKAGFDAEAVNRECQPWEQRIIDAQAKMMTLRGDHPDLPRLGYVIEQCQQKLIEIRTRHEKPVRDAQGARRPGRRYHYGLIAQEVKEVLDFEGQDAAFWKQSSDGLQSLSYSELLSPLISAVQELAAEIRELRQKVSALEDKA